MDLCRFCLRSINRKSFISISEDGGNGFSVIDMIKSSINVQIAVNDDLPQIICSNCNRLLIATFDFNNLIKQSDEKLRKKRKAEELFKNSLAQFEDQDDDTIERFKFSIPAVRPIHSYEKEIEEDDNEAEEIEAEEIEEEETVSKEQTSLLILKLDETISSLLISINNRIKTKIAARTEKEKLEDLKKEPAANYDNLAGEINFSAITFSEVGGEELEELEAGLDDDSVGAIKQSLVKKCKLDSFECCGCKSEFVSQKYLREHSKSHEHDRHEDPTKPYECKICFKRFRKNESLLIHRKMDSKTIYEKNIKRVEQIMLSSQTDLEATTEKRCCGCDNKFATMEELKKHSVTIHESFRKFDANPKKAFECDLCFKRYATSVILEQHKLMPYREKNFPCPNCNKRFPSTQLLKRHSYLHSVRVQCETCSKMILQHNLKSHMKIHASLEFICFYCGKGFVTKGNLKAHILTHTKERPFLCSLCPKRFSSRQKMDVHTRSHTGIRPYSCNYCDKTFGHWSDWRRHEMSHTGNYPYTCRECGRRFARKTHWKQHESTHGINCNESEME